MSGKFVRYFAIGIAITGASCSSVPPSTAPMAGPNGNAAMPGAPIEPAATGNVPGMVQNPIFVAANTADPNIQEIVTERAVDILHHYNFEVDVANQLEGTIATQYKVGSGVLEPWHKESVGMGNRWESTFQSIRRKVLIHLVRVDGGYLVGVEALKELEDLASATTNSPGGSTFISNQPLRRDLNLILGQPTPSGWLPLGRDLALEQDMLCRLQKTYTR